MTVDRSARRRAARSRWAWGLAGLLLLAHGHAATLKNTRVWHSPEGTRVVFDMDGPASFDTAAYNNPPRLAIDVTGGRIAGRLPTPADLGPLIARIRSAQFDTSTLRVVLDLKRGLDWKVFQLSPGGGYGYRLVIDLDQPDIANARPEIRPPSQPSTLVVAVDPGHGGEDPGAIGPRGTQEKDVVLAISQELVREINSRPGMRAILTRKGDYYISLRRRIELARQAGADLFVSIHADAVRSRKARGSSVYALSQKGATSETGRLLAQKENLSDLAGGVTLKDKDDPLAYVLLDLSMTRTVSDSLEFAGEILNQLTRIGPVHSPRVEQAGFVVLKSPDIPSVLVETAYISNPTEEKQLRSRSHQRRIAAAILKGIEAYAKKLPARG